MMDVFSDGIAKSERRGGTGLVLDFARVPTYLVFQISELLY